jgi:allantoinase
VSAYDLIVRGATVAPPDAPALVADVAVADGRIAAIGPALEGGGHEELDGRGLHLLPGAIDPHVHLDDPGRTDWEGWATGTAALAAGGATTCVDMPLNALPPTVDAAAFRAKVAAATGVARVDYALWGGLVPGNAAELEELAALGVVGFKAFMSPTGVDDFVACGEADLRAGMEVAARVGLPVGVHAESPAVTEPLREAAVAEGRLGMRDYGRTRPARAELEAIELALALARETGCSLHVVHVSTARGVALVAAARAAGVDATCEVCTHHLVLSDEDAERIGTLAKCAPPLRSGDEIAALWRRVGAGEAALVASDHSPTAPAEREGPAMTAWGGITGAQSTLETFLTEGHVARGLTLGHAARLLSLGAAERFRLPGKGRLEVGADADLALVDLRAQRVLRAEELRYRHPTSPFVGRTLHARVLRTLLRGRTIYAHGADVGPPRGGLVRPDRAPLAAPSG